MARITEGDGVLIVKIGGDNFHGELARVKSTPGMRYNGAEKVWEGADNDETLLKLVHTLEPDMPASIAARVRKAKNSQADDLITKLPDDAPIAVPWQSRLVGKQRAGIDFMAAHPHVILADDMGSGKTVQAISTVYEHHIRANPGAVGTDTVTRVPDRKLVIAPAAVLNHWRRELKKWAGVESVIIIDGKSKEERKEQLLSDSEWVLVNWEKLQKRVGLLPELLKVKWYGVVADEAHRAKNHNSQQSKALAKLKAPVQIAATGTPVMNNPAELYGLLRWLRPEQYTSYWTFYYQYTDYYKGYAGRDVIVGVKNVDELRFELSDKMVRRTKREIHPTIPVPFDPVIYEPELTTPQAKVYGEAEKDFWLEVVQDAKEDAIDPDAIQSALDSGDLETVKMMIKNAGVRTLRMRQIATSPAVLGGEDSSGKLDTMEEIVRGAPDHPFVIFAWFKESVELIARRLAAADIDVEWFHGGKSREERDDIAERFQNEEFDVIVCGISTGGVGINLHRAQDVIFVEEDWVPGINQQAVDRLDRMGQEGRVQTHIIRAKGTVDTGTIAPKLSTKKLITDTILGGS